MEHTSMDDNNLSPAGSREARLSERPTIMRTGLERSEDATGCRHPLNYLWGPLLASSLILLIMAAIAIPNMMSCDRCANECSALGSLKNIITAESRYYKRHHEYGFLHALELEGLIDPVLGAATTPADAKSCFYFSLRLVATNKYYIYGNPVPSSGYPRAFYTDETGVIASRNDPTATADRDYGGDFTNSSWSVVGQ